MSDELLPYYRQELSYIRHLAAEFAQGNGKIAGRLRIGPEGTEDPHVERIIEGFAFLNARIRHKLDDDFPELTDSLLGILYPHYQAPVPSMAIFQFELDRTQGELLAGYDIARGEEVEAESPDGLPCRFRTCYPLTLWPIEVVRATFAGQPFSAPLVSFGGAANAVLRLELKCISPAVTFAQLAAASRLPRRLALRFFLSGQAQHAFAMYEMILNNTLGVAVASSPRDPSPTVLNTACVRPAGFEVSMTGDADRDEGMLPYTSRSLPGYRLLTEFFTFPQKFLFFELAGIERGALGRADNTLEIYLYFNQASEQLERHTGREMFQLGCSPVVNLYAKTAEPITLTHTQTEYRVLPDARRPLEMEVYSIDGVVAESTDTRTAGGSRESLRFEPFYSFKHASAELSQRAFWQAARRPAGYSSGKLIDGTEVFLSLVDLDFNPWVRDNWIVHVETTCLDRNRPYQLWSAGQPRLRVVSGGPLSRIACLAGPTPTFRPALRYGAMWRIISHLALNHRSLADYEEGADALREILKIYDFADSEATRKIISGVRGVRGRRVVGRVPGGLHSGFCRGMEVTVDLDEGAFVGSGLYLFAAVLERFCGLYCNINSFSKLVATTDEGKRVLCRWPPRAGETVLL